MLDSELQVEAIPFPEVERCIEVGFSPGQIILNGPGKWWRSQDTCIEGKLGAIFCDSERDLDLSLDRISKGRLGAWTIGVRLAPVHYRSRFGIQVTNRQTFRYIANRLGVLPQ